MAEVEVALNNLEEQVIITLVYRKAGLLELR
jgi:hypothetical protein